MYLIWRMTDSGEQLIGYADDQVEAALIIEDDREALRCAQGDTGRFADADYRFEEEKKNGRGRAASQG